jgi:hypothetical protein
MTSTPLLLKHYKLSSHINLKYQTKIYKNDQPCTLNNSFKRKVYLYDRADFSSYREQLSQVNFDNLFASDDIDSITRSIVQILINEVDKAIPNRIITVRKDNLLWLTTEIKTISVKKKTTQTCKKKRFGR